MFAKKAAPKVCKYGNGKDFSNFESKKLSKMAIHWFVSGNTKVFLSMITDYHKGLAKLTVETICTNSLSFLLLNYKNKSQLNIQH